MTDVQEKITLELPVDAIVDGADATLDAAANIEKQIHNDETATDKTDNSVGEPPKSPSGSGPKPVVSSSKKSRPIYKYDPEKITLRFLFANHDGLTVTVECEPSDTVGEVKGALLSVWPKDLPNCAGGDRVRLVCMGKGFLMPDSRTLEECQIPTFKTHPTPINVTVKPEVKDETKLTKNEKESGTLHSTAQATSQGCGCVIM